MIVTLQFRNPDYMLLFRGQREDHRRMATKNKEIATLMPTLFRAKGGRVPPSLILIDQFKILKRPSAV